MSDRLRQEAQPLQPARELRSTPSPTDTPPASPGSRPANFEIASWPLLTCHSGDTSTEPAHPSRGHIGVLLTAPPNTRADCVPSAPRANKSPRDAATPRASLRAVRTALRLSGARGLPLDNASAVLATRTGKQKYRASHGWVFVCC